jgi:hypothetical protein
MLATQASDGFCQLPFFTKAAVGVLLLLRATLGAAKAACAAVLSLPAATRGSQPRITSAAAMPTRVVQMLAWVGADDARGSRWPRTFLRQPCGILGDDAFALHVRRHAQQLPNGDDPCAPHPSHHHAAGTASAAACTGWGNVSSWGTVCGGLPLPFFFSCPPSTVTKLGQKALHATHILVATALVDGAFSAKLGFKGLDGQAVALHPAVAAAFAHQLR